MLRCLDCTRPALPRRSRCAEHQRQRENARSARRGRTGWERQQTNAAIIARDGGCMGGGPHGGRLTVDHITPLCAGGSDTPDNKRALCERCHDVKTRREASRGVGVR